MVFIHKIRVRFSVVLHRIDYRLQALVLNPYIRLGFVTELNKLGSFRKRIQAGSRG
jgi:hypothetical protein